MTDSTDARPLEGKAGDHSTRLLAKSIGALACLSLLGLVCAWLISALGLDLTHRGTFNIFFYLFSTYEPSTFITFLALCAVFYIAAIRRPALLEAPAIGWDRVRGRLGARSAVMFLAIAVVGVTCAGWLTVYHQHPFAMDEYGAVFQSRIFAAGQVSATLVGPWPQLAPWLKPVFVNYDPQSQSWISAYLPVYALLRAPFELLGVPGLLNPLLAGGSVLAVACLARHMWSGWSAGAGIAALLLASSPQFLITSMSAYSMPAHLLFGIVWLSLYVRATKMAWLALPWCGALAMGVHQFVPHALFALPFLFRVVLNRKWGWAAYFAAVYLLASAFWVGWLSHFAAPNTGSALSQTFGWPGVLQVLTQASSLCLLASWQSFGLCVLFLVGVATAGADAGRAALMRDLTAGVVLALVLYGFMVADQGHGWGYRYAYAVLGNVVLLAAHGLHQLETRFADGRAFKVVVLGAAFAFCVQVPARCLEVDAMVRPFAVATAAIARMPEEFVLVPVRAAWYGQDLIRNDPFLRERPKVMHLAPLPDNTHGLLRRGKTRVISAAELRAFGLFPTL